MVLHHVARRAGAVIELAAALHADLLGQRDLHVAHPGAGPQWLEQGITEAQRDQVLHRFLAKVMVDAKDLALFEYRADLFIDELGGSQVAAQRLFQDDPRRRRDQVGVGQIYADYVKQAGSCG